MHRLQQCAGDDRVEIVGVDAGCGVDGCFRGSTPEWARPLLLPPITMEGPSTGAGWLHRPTVTVDQSVVETTEQHQVAEVRGPSIGPVHDVMGMQELHRTTAREPTRPVPRVEEAPQPRIGQSTRTSEVSGVPVLTIHAERQTSVARPPPQVTG